MKLCLCAIAVLATCTLAQAADPYEDYMRTSPDFRPVKQEKAWALKAWPSWTYMPWTYQWTIGYHRSVWALEHRARLQWRLH